MKRIISLILVSLLSLTMLTACSKKTLNIVTTSYPVQYLVQQIAKDRVNISSLSDSSGVAQRAQIVTANPDGTSASTPYYKTLLKEADIIFSLGELEPYMMMYTSELSESKATKVDLSNFVALQEFQRYTLIQTSNDSTLLYSDKYYNSTAFDSIDKYAYDPSVWMDPMQMVSMGREILSQLIAVYPEEEKFFTANFDTLYTNLTNLDYEFSRFKLLNRSVSFVSLTPSFGYWQRSYYVNVYPVVISKYGVLPNEQQLDAIRQRILEDGVQYIVHEYNLPEAYEELYESLKNDLGLTEIRLSNLYQLTADDIDSNRDYISLMNANIIEIENIAE